MKFTKTIRDTDVLFETSDNEGVTTVNILIPPYGSWKRGEHYTIEELNEIVLKEMGKNLIPQTTEGKCRALRKEAKTIVLKYETKIKKNIVKKQTNLQERFEKQPVKRKSSKSKIKKQ